MTEEQQIEKKPHAEMVRFIKDGGTFGYDVRPGFFANVYSVDLEYLAAIGVIEWKPKRVPVQKQSVLVLKKRNKRK